MPAAAAYAAIAFAAFPAEGTERVVAPRCAARVTAADRPRALNEFVGFSDSSLTKSRAMPTSAPSRPAWTSGVQPFAERNRTFAVEERHQFAVPPHRGLAPRDGLAGPAARRVEVVSGEEGSAAGAEVLLDARIVWPGAAGHRALQMERRRTRATFRGAPCLSSSAGRRSWRCAGRWPSARLRAPAARRLRRSCDP